MSILSAQTLFHYTKKEYLISIIKEGFNPRYSKEFVKEKNEGLTLGDHLYIPMVCFCDTPLSLVEKHMDFYGSYGIGLSKDWGIKNKLNPVFYINSTSLVHDKLITSVHSVVLNSLGDHNMSHTLDNLVYLYRYMKPYRASVAFERAGKEYIDYQYYDEKEWRYVPDYLQTDERILIPHPTETEMQMFNEKLKKHSLKFCARDINFIIIDNSNDLDDILGAIDESPMFSEKDKEYLLTTFITAESIRKNF